MATPDTQNIFVGAPLQATTGAIFTAPVGSAAPTDAVTALDAAFESSGYVTEDGVSLTGNRTTINLRDWSRKTVKTILDSFEPTVSFSLMEWSAEGVQQAFGDDAVTMTPATASTGTRLTVAVDGEMPTHKAWCFNMKDGDARVRLYLPDAVPSNVPDLTFVANDAINIPVELALYPDEAGNFFYIFTDNGVTA